MSQAVLDGVRDLLPTFRERADDTERMRVVPESSVKQLQETGFFRFLQPRRFDGLEGDPVDFYTHPQTPFAATSSHEVPEVTGRRPG